MPQPKRTRKTGISVGWRWKEALGRLTDPASPLPIIAALAAVLLVLATLAVLYLALPALRSGYWPGAFVEATGFLFDLVFFGAVLALIIHWRDNKRERQRYQEEIQDFKRWDSEEGRLRIAGAIRRLGRTGKTDIDFRGMKLTNFSFKSNDIRSIRGATFYDGEWGTLSSREEVVLEQVDFSFVDCANVMFSRFNPFSGLSSIAPPVKIIDCSFCNANLRGAVFRGAVLTWSEAPPDTIYEEVENPDGSIGLTQVVHPAFDGADLANASFAEVQFRNADFRCTENILEADFSGATGLESCAFDDNTVRDAILKSAAAGISN